MRAENIKFSLSKLSKPAQIILLSIVAFVVFFIVRAIQAWIKNAAAKKKVREDASRLQNDPKTNYNSEQAIQRASELKQLAVNCSKAVWNFQPTFGVLGFWTSTRVDEDEEAFIANLNQCETETEAVLISELYVEYNNSFNTGKGTSMKSDAEEYLSTSELNRINSLIRNNIK